MLKRKLKLSLVEDYIKVNSISNFCSSNLALKNIKHENCLIWIKTLSEKMQQAYDKLLFRFKIMDVSLLVLKRELKQSNMAFGEKQSSSAFYEEGLRKCLSLEKEIYNSLQEKLNKLSLSPIEQSYIIKDLAKIINEPVNIDI